MGLKSSGKYLNSVLNFRLMLYMYGCWNCSMPCSKYACFCSCELLVCACIFCICAWQFQIYIYMCYYWKLEIGSPNTGSVCVKLTGSDIYIHIYMLLCDRLKHDRFSSYHNNGFPSLVNIRNTAVLMPVTIFFSMLVNIRIQFRFHDACQIQWLVHWIQFRFVHSFSSLNWSSSC